VRFRGRFRTAFLHSVDFVAKADIRPFARLSKSIDDLNETGDTFGDLNKGNARENDTDIR
jgi:hypothetical protein